MTRLVKFGLIPALIVLSIVAITVNVFCRLVKKPAKSETVTIEKIVVKPEKIR